MLSLWPVILLPLRTIAMAAPPGKVRAAVARSTRACAESAVELSIVIPVYNEAQVILDNLRRLHSVRESSARDIEIIVVDGGSADSTVAVCAELADGVFVSPVRGRAAQMNVGVQQARADNIWFLHADTLAPATAASTILNALESKRERPGWGRFDIQFSSDRAVFRLIAFCMNLRSRLTAVATGDQGIFVRRELFQQVGGFAEQPLMEDICLSKALAKIARPHCLRQRLITSSRRWEQNGVLKTILLMWWLRARYYFGADPAELARLYNK